VPLPARAGAFHRPRMLDNLTPFAAEILPLTGPRGQAQSVVVVKATLDFQGRAVSAERALPVLRAPVFFDDPARLHDLRMDSDVHGHKPLVDVIVNAIAHAPRGKAVPQFEAGLRVGAQHLALRVSGARRWQRRWGGAVPAIGAAEPVRQLPLIYSLAYGGTDPKRPEQFWPANPSGIGFSAGPPVEGLPLPQVEWADDRYAGKAPPALPGGFGACPIHWMPRRAWLGSYAADELAAKGLPAALPASADARAANSAHPRLQFGPDQVGPGTAIELHHLSEEGLVRFELPLLTFDITVTTRDKVYTVQPRFDTLTIEPEHAHLVLTFRHRVDDAAPEDLLGVRVHMH